MKTLDVFETCVTHLLHAIDGHHGLKVSPLIMFRMKVLCYLFQTCKQKFSKYRCNWWAYLRWLVYSHSFKEILEIPPHQKQTYCSIGFRNSSLQLAHSQEKTDKFDVNLDAFCTSIFQLERNCLPDNWNYNITPNKFKMIGDYEYAKSAYISDYINDC